MAAYFCVSSSTVVSPAFLLISARYSLKQAFRKEFLSA